MVKCFTVREFDEFKKIDLQFKSTSSLYIYYNHFNQDLAYQVISYLKSNSGVNTVVRKEINQRLVTNNIYVIYLEDESKAFLLRKGLDNYFLRLKNNDVDLVKVIKSFLMIIDAVNLDLIWVNYDLVKVGFYDSSFLIDGVFIDQSFDELSYDLGLDDVLIKKELNLVLNSKFSEKVIFKIRLATLVNPNILSIFTCLAKEDKERLVIEVSSLDNIFSSEMYLRVIKLLKSFDIDLLIGDFGSNYANLNYLTLDYFKYLRISKELDLESKEGKIILRLVNDIAKLRKISLI